MLSEILPREQTRKHAVYDSVELNRRWTPLWGFDRGGLVQVRRYVPGNCCNARGSLPHVLSSTALGCLPDTVWSGDFACCAACLPDVPRDAFAEEGFRPWLLGERITSCPPTGLPNAVMAAPTSHAIDGGADRTC